MNNITKYNLKTIAISVTGLILLFCVLSFLIAPQSDIFKLESINPLVLLVFVWVKFEVCIEE
ncbi:hypothetical protein BN938_1094 [Mucinivorans hirudinis]|uniref:Uncharacterized protein n=1 Tax=Mucinivorans hirudinis TaxID=1433126 RepID=A0A060R7H2_9BACT|nr:hypothetical protein BN938_1094 [Mucinivorans hirudinis]